MRSGLLSPEAALPQQADEEHVATALERRGAPEGVGTGSKSEA